MNVLNDPRLQELVDKLQVQSQAQEEETAAFFHNFQFEHTASDAATREQLEAQATRFLADKLVALEPIKAEFCFLVCRAIGARRVVEIGTSHGVSTIFLASAVRATLASTGGSG